MKTWIIRDTIIDAKGENIVRAHRIITVLLWVASFLCLGFCLFLSWQPGEESTEFSLGIVHLIKRILWHFGFQVNASQLHKLLRLFAHFAVFFAVGALFCGSFSLSLQSRAYAPLAAFLLTGALCGACALGIEAVKRYIPGRHLQWNEAFIDVAGVVAGALVAALIAALVRCIGRRRSRKTAR